MIDGVAFQTRARTVDHLGREQIADCPTAISELWKNAFDAYARHVALDIYDGDVPVAIMSDDGHGMNRAEFVGRWLVVGTESKAADDRTPERDRNGLPVRPRQGQKGIGRLSCANLGPLLLLMSKRVDQPYVAALVDWRLFENPFLILSDVEIPVVEGDDPRELLAQLPGLARKLAENVKGTGEDARRKRLDSAWKDYDDASWRQFDRDTEDGFVPPSAAILRAIGDIPFTDRHLANWPVFTGEAAHGTALLVSEINFDLTSELRQDVGDTASRASQERFFETLMGFVDPFTKPEPGRQDGHQLEFSYLVRAWTGEVPRTVVGDDKNFNRATLDRLEHQFEGVIDANGRFEGRVKAFGTWIEGPCVIDPPKDLALPRRADSQVGPFDIYIAAMEFRAENSSHDKLQHQQFMELAERYAGFMLFRDKLRVLPFGRTDNDFFEIEMRRSLRAGREFWNHRQMFGRIAIERNRNPNLKDKAGREGLLDNRAAKTLRAIVSNLLKVSARRYFGSDSDVRNAQLPEIQAANRATRASEARNKLRSKHRSEFRARLKTASKAVPKLAEDIRRSSEVMRIEDVESIAAAQTSLEQFRDAANELKVPGAPKNLGTLEETYEGYKGGMREIASLLEQMRSTIEARIEAINPAEPRELLEKQVQRNAAQIHSRIRLWRSTLEDLLKGERERLGALLQERNKLFHAEASPLLARFDRDELSYIDCSRALDAMRSSMDQENEQIFVSYIGALRSLKESIDLEHLAISDMEEMAELRVELERLNALAQLGIAVEIVGHDLQDFDDIIGSGLRNLPTDVRNGRAASDIRLGYEGLTNQLRFLSPLRLAGEKVERQIRGAEIADYVEEFFRPALAKAKVRLIATPAFRSFSVFDQPSRLFPVFINLVNNSIYWLGTSSTGDRKIVLDVVDQDIVISDNGPGVDAEDVARLFGLFFTRKGRGGRGVGLYLARANLAAGGHRIRYELPSHRMPMGGANFIISFRGAEFSAG
ncbi:ATP-binding protein [Methylorubrum rhodesianum]|uniref:ATP-binding protein n=1 Tax=Methylorubrum rhodesianum TaxID=29427 RepID=UPI003CFC9357